MEPWGTPVVIGDGGVETELMQTDCVQLVRYDDMRLNAVPERL
jgi:hypothetical protein